MTDYMESDSWQVRRAIADSWDSFDVDDFSQSILAKSSTWGFSWLPVHGKLVTKLDHVERLVLSVRGGDDLGPLAGLSQLSSLSLRGLRGDAAVDLSPLASLSQLSSLELALGLWRDAVVDLSTLASLSQLSSLELGLWHDAVVDLSPLAGLSQLSLLAVWGGAAERLLSTLRPNARKHGLTIVETRRNTFVTTDRDSLALVRDKTIYLPANA
jgi:hypothetical protein